MQLDYCDLCNSIIHGKKYTMLVVEETVSDNFSKMSDILGSNYTSKYYKEKTKTICSKCKNIIDSIFYEKQIALKEITQEIRRLYKLSGTERPKSDE